MTPRPALVDPQVVPRLATQVVPCHWQNQRLPGPMSLANDTKQQSGAPEAPGLKLTTGSETP